MSSGPSRLVLALLVLTVLGLLAALFLLQDGRDPGQTGQPRDPQGLAAPTADGRVPTLVPDPRAAELPALPMIDPDPEAQLIPEGQRSPAQVVGRIVVKGGAPLPGALLQGFVVGGGSAWLQYLPVDIQALSGEDGRFRLVGLPLGETLALEVSHIDAAPAMVEPVRLQEGQVLDLGDVILDKGLSLYGKVLDPEGRAIQGARLLVSDVGRATADAGLPEPTVVTERITDALGEYTIEHLGRRQYTVDINAEGYAPLQSTIAFMLNNSSGSYEQDYVLEGSGFALGGVVLGPEEQAVPGATIELVRRVPNNKAYYMLKHVTDEQGVFLFEGLAEGRYDVRFSSDDWYLPLPIKLDAGRTDQVLRAQHAITVVGTVLATDGMPPKVTVTATPDARTGARVLGQAGRDREFELDDSGRFEFGGLRSGSYVLLVKAAGYAATRSQDLILGQDVLEVPVTVRLRSGGSISGKLAKATPNAVVELRDGEWDPNGPLDFAFPTKPVHGLRVKTGKTGAFRLAHVPAGSYVLSVKTPGMPNLHVRDLQLVDGEAIDVGVLTREVGGTVLGRITSSRGSGLNGASVSLSGAAARLRTTANMDGTFRFDSVPAGEYEITAVPKAFFEAFRFEARQDINVESGETLELDLFLEERAIPVSTTDG